MRKILQMLVFVAIAAMPWAIDAQCTDGTPCQFTIVGTDTYGDGWEGNLVIYRNNVQMSTFTVDASTNTEVFTVCEGDSVRIEWNGSDIYHENVFSITGGNGTVYVNNAYGYTYASSGVVVEFVACPSCAAPQGLSMVSSTISSLTIQWSPSTGEGEWDVMVGDSLIAGVLDTLVTIHNLMASSSYDVKVRAVCGSDDTSQWCYPVSMLTACATIYQLPVTYTFENDADGTMPACWSRPTAFNSMDYISGGITQYPLAMVDATYAHSGSKSMVFLDYGVDVTDDPAYAVTPYIYGDPSALHVTYWMQSELLGQYISFEAGVMSDPTDTSTFIPFVFTNADPAEYTQYEFNTSSLTGYSYGDSICVAFRVRATAYGMGLVVLDDIVIDNLGDCMAPTLSSGNIDSVSYDAALLSWECAEMPDEFDVMLVQVGGVASPALHYATTDTALLVTNLDGNTIYMASVASICGSDTTTYTPIGQFETDYRCYAVESLEVVAITSNAATLQWSMHEGGIYPTEIEITLFDLTDSILYPSVEVNDTDRYTFTELVTNHVYRATFIVVCGASDSSLATSTVFMPHPSPCAEFAGTLTNNNVPFNGYYKYGYTQQLYDNSQMGNFDTITGISFEVSSPHTLTHIVDIYLGYTTQTNLNGTNYIPTSQMTKVVSNYHFAPNTAGWIDVIPFDTVFVRPDSGNLVVTVVNNTGTYQANLVWACHNATVGTSVRWYTDSAPIDPATTTANPNTVTVAPNIQLYGNCERGDCQAPSVSVASVDSTSITLAWLSAGNESSWNVQYRADTATAWTDAGVATSTSYTVTGLIPATNYMFRVGSMCTDTAYSSAISATTACAQIHSGYSITLGTNSLCWTYLPGGSYYYSSTYNSFYLYTEYAGIISPAIAEPINTLQVRIVDSDPYNDGVSYMVGVCGEGGDSVTWLQTITATPSEFGTHIVHLNNYSGNGDRIILKSNDSYSTYIRSVSIETLANCLPVTALTLDSVTTTDAWVSWQSPATSFEVRYRTSDTTATWTTINTSSASVHLTGLASATRYVMEVRTVCSSTEMSDSSTIQFTTGCVNFTVPYSETFGNVGLPLCWNTYAGITYYSWEETAEDGEAYIYSYADVSTNPANDWVMTPVINIPADAAFTQVSLIYAVGGGPESYYPASNAAYQVLASTTGNDSPAHYTDTLLVDTVNTVDASGNYSTVYRYIPLGSYAGQSVSFAFRNTSVRYGMVMIGDVSVRSTLTPLYDITGYNTAFTGETNSHVAVYREGDTTGMTFLWTSTMAAAGRAVMTSANTDTMQIVYNAAGIDTITFVATNSYGSYTAVDVVDVFQCDVVDAFPWSEGFDDESSIICWRQQGNNVWTIGSGDYQSSSTAHSGAANVQLLHRNNGDVTRLISPVFDLSGVADVTLTFWHTQRSWAGDQDELHVLGRASAGEAWVTLATYTNSIDTWTLDTVVLNSNSSTFQFAFEGHDSYGYGIAIDDVVVDGIDACIAPVINGIVPGEDNLVVTYTTAADSVEVIVTASTFDPASAGIVSASSPYAATGLSHSTNYTVALRSICGTGYYSDWTVETVSTLTVDCQTPTNLTVVATTYTSATIGWTANGEESAWEIRAYNTLDTVTATAVANPFTITGLTSGTTYSVDVRALCGQNSNVEGDWSDAVQVTVDPCTGLSDVTVTDVTANSAKVNWTPVADIVGYRISYGDSNFYDSEADTVSVPANANSYNITNLVSDHSYEVYVQIKCSESLYSMVTAADRIAFHTQGDTDGIYDVESGTLTLYPNPASASVTLTVSGFDGEVTVEVVDLNGKRISELRTLNSELQIDLGQFAHGAYFVRVTSEHQTVVRKLIVR